MDFFNQINMLYGTITEFCTEESCPIMSAGPKYEYHWADGLTVKKPIKCSAPKYIDYLMTWVQDQLDDETLFPSKIGNKKSCSVMLSWWQRKATLQYVCKPSFIFCYRCSFPKKFPVNSKNYPEAAVSSLCSHLPPAFLWSGTVRWGGTSQHFL